MQQYSITSPQFKGICKALYINGTLASFDFIDCLMDDNQIKVFKQIVPVKEAELEAAFSTTKCTIVASDYEITFKMFYSQGLPKRNPLRAEKIWDKMNAADKVAAHFGVKPYLKGLNGTAPCHPDSYLTYKRWLDGK